MFQSILNNVDLVVSIVSPCIKALSINLGVAAGSNPVFWILVSGWFGSRTVPLQPILTLNTIVAVRVVIRAVCTQLSLSLPLVLSLPLIHSLIVVSCTLSFSLSLSLSLSHTHTLCIRDRLCRVKQPQRCLTPSSTGRCTTSVMLPVSNYL